MIKAVLTGFSGIIDDIVLQTGQKCDNIVLWTQY